VNCTKSTQFAPKFAYMRSKIEKFFWGWALLPLLHPLGASGASIVAPTALELGAVVPHLLILKPPLFGSHTSFLGNDPCEQTNTHTFSVFV